MAVGADGIVATQIGGDGIVPQLPPGYRFLPTDEELIIFYLQNKVCFRPVPCEAVKDIDANELYSNPPNTIVNFTVADNEKEWYFFIHQNKYQKEAEKIQMTAKNKKKKKKRRKFKELEKKKKGRIRMVGNGIGFWRSVGKEDPIYDNNGKVLGSKFSSFISQVLQVEARKHIGGWKNTICQLLVEEGIKSGDGHRRRQLVGDEKCRPKEKGASPSPRQKLGESFHTSENMASEILTFLDVSRRYAHVVCHQSHYTKPGGCERPSIFDINHCQGGTEDNLSLDPNPLL
ncbi:NAC domain-containing protein [Sesamum alatum]|uniref:NAC domain-containing protein n=1 Tax=Sesamum alatum TaxID=300844 RepID=A0AAE1YCK2_9LAMI|nr:NAC domain-containing protein [Sesamum alatum]